LDPLASEIPEKKGDCGKKKKELILIFSYPERLEELTTDIVYLQEGKSQLFYKTLKRFAGRYR